MTAQPTTDPAGIEAKSSYTPAPGARFAVGDRVRVHRAHPPGHRRSPHYIRGKVGTIERICGAFPNPEELAYGFTGEPRHVLYRVSFGQPQVWDDYAGPDRDKIEMEIFEHWLEAAPATAAAGGSGPAQPTE